MNIFEYYREQLGVAPADLTLRGLPVESNCGQDCKRAIDTAKTLIDCVMQTFPSAQREKAILDITFHVVSIYWRG